MDNETQQQRKWNNMMIFIINDGKRVSVNGKRKAAKIREKRVEFFVYSLMACTLFGAAFLYGQLIATRVLF